LDRFQQLAVAVHHDIDYVVVQSTPSGTCSRRALAPTPASWGRADRGRRRSSTADLLGRYTPPFASSPARQRARVLAGRLRHHRGRHRRRPPGAPPSARTTRRPRTPPASSRSCPVDGQGRFTAEVAPYAGQQVFEANKQIVHDLKAGPAERRRPAAAGDVRPPVPALLALREPAHLQGRLVVVRQGHRASRTGWSSSTSRSAGCPSHIKDGSFGKWLENARDWSISRTATGAAHPVWVSDDPRYPRVDVYGSLDELERDFGVRPADLHRPYVDDLTRPNPDDPTGGSTMRRVPEVLDCWFESGSMPFAQVHYPFENADWFEHHYPGDFIVEYIGQTRGWFYTLHVLATALFDRPAFRTCVSHGILLGDDGPQDEQSLRNYPDVREVFERDGSDAMRWSSCRRRCCAAATSSSPSRASARACGR
jgi:isoleucyl-tRNA synthetase